MNPSVSVIVPVYNAGATLRRCVESVLNQEYTGFELLLADDGSRDGSAALCDRFAREEYAAHMMENPADFYYGVL